MICTEDIRSMAEKSDNRRLPTPLFMNAFHEQPRELDGRNGSPHAHHHVLQPTVGPPKNTNASDCCHTVFYPEEYQQCQEPAVSNAALGNPHHGFDEQVPPLPSYSELYGSTSSSVNQYWGYGRHDDTRRSYFTQHGYNGQLEGESSVPVVIRQQQIDGVGMIGFPVLDVNENQIQSRGNRVEQVYQLPFPPEYSYDQNARHQTSVRDWLRYAQYQQEPVMETFDGNAFDLTLAGLNHLVPPEEIHQSLDFVNLNAIPAYDYLGFFEEVPPPPSYSELFGTPSSSADSYMEHDRNVDAYQSDCTHQSPNADLSDDRRQNHDDDDEPPVPDVIHRINEHRRNGGPSIGLTAAEVDQYRIYSQSRGRRVLNAKKLSSRQSGQQNN